jgi:hypothetical protein
MDSVLALRAPRNDGLWRMARKTPTSVQLHKYKASDLCLTRANGELNP